MKLPTALLLGLVVSASIFKLSLAEPPFSDVEIVDGKCTYGNYSVADGEHINLADPCQQWLCQLESKRFAWFGCIDAIEPPNCHLERGTGVFPDCCDRPVCP
uniref:Putative 8.9 kDa protein n=1 Tax=Ixodes ricinus TaxID=34613 RepID=A0A6B0U9D5_IXORI